MKHDRIQSDRYRQAYRGGLADSWGLEPEPSRLRDALGTLAALIAIAAVAWWVVV